MKSDTTITVINAKTLSLVLCLKYNEFCWGPNAYFFAVQTRLALMHSQPITTQYHLTVVFCVISA